MDCIMHYNKCDDLDILNNINNVQTCARYIGPRGDQGDFLQILSRLEGSEELFQFSMNR